MKNIGFIGLGLMGIPLCKRLLEAGFNLHVWNRTPNKAQALVDQGAQLLASPQQLVQACEVVCLCLTDTQAVEEVLLQGPQPLIGQLQPGQIILDFSSIAPAATQGLAALVAQKGAQWIDAPVSGGVQGAEQGQLAIMCGGEASTLDKVRPLLTPLARQITHLGPAGSGQIAKVCNQMLVTCQAAAIAEVMALAQQAGIDAALLPVAFRGGFADSLPLQLLAPRMAAQDFSQPKWTLATLLKDLNLSADCAQQLGQATPMSRQAAELIRLQGLQSGLQVDPAQLVELFQSAPAFNRSFDSSLDPTSKPQAQQQGEQS